MQDERFAPPEPPGVVPVKALPIWRYVVIAILLVGLAGAAIFIPIPVVFLYVPGPIRDAEDLVHASDATTYSSEGSLYMTTVSVDTSVTFMEVVFAWFDPEQDVVMREQVTGGQSLQELRVAQRAEMRASQNSATQVALGQLGIDRPTGRGAEIVRAIQGSPAHEVLRPNDVIIEIDGDPVQTTCDVGSRLGEKEAGDRIAITFDRAGSRREAEVTLAQSPFGPGAFLGVEMKTVDFSFEPGIDVDFETGRIAGPSAGLMLSLALYDQLTPEDLTSGRQIAGTGTLGCDGDVGPIGGIRQKVAAARAEGAEIFLAPEGNVEEARSIGDGIEIVPVATFAQALGYLSGLE
jgi:PDZ domain-containing protein